MDGGRGGVAEDELVTNAALSFSLRSLILERESFARPSMATQASIPDGINACSSSKALGDLGDGSETDAAVAASLSASKAPPAAVLD